MILKLKPEFASEYIRLHNSPDPLLLDALSASNIRNNSVFYINDLLFNYFEYHGNDFYSDWQKYVNSPAALYAFAKMKGFFKPYGESFPKTSWTEMQEVFHKE